MTNDLRSRLKSVSLFFLAVAALLATTEFVVFQNISDLEQQDDLITESRELITELEQVISALKDAETGMRGFALSLDPSHLQIFRYGRERVWKILDQLENRRSLNPSYQENLARLRRTIRERIDSLDSLEDEVRESSGQRKEMTLPIEEEQSEMMRARRIADRLAEAERSILSRRSAEAERGAIVIRVVILVAAVINLALVFAAYYFIRRNMIAQEDEARRKAHEAWLRSGEAEVGALVAGDQNLRSLSGKAVRFLSDSLQIPAANLYLVRDGTLEFMAGHLAPGRNSSQDPPVRLPLGQGLLGRAALGDELMEVTDVPADYFQIESSLGASTPKLLYFVPLKFQEESVGVFEVASFKPINEASKSWLSLVSKILAAGVATARGRERLQELLEETQRQAEELQSRQEELRATNVELESQAKTLNAQQEELRQVNEELERQALTLEERQSDLNVRNSELEKISRDLEQKARELERISQYKSEFLAKMSHELRTPLNSLMILATLLRENKNGNLSAQQIEFAKTIQESGEDLLNLINDILDLSKLEARKLTPRPERFVLRSFMEQIAVGFRPVAEARGLGFEYAVGDEVAERLLTDRQRLQQVLRNLLSNAFKFTEKGSVKVQVLKSPVKNKYIRFVVEDTGTGIPEDKRRLIWEAFEQGDGSVSRQFGGTGLGLTISRELAHLLKGTIWVESALGQGSRFILEIPEEMPEPGERTDAARSEDSTTPRAEAHGERRRDQPPIAAVSTPRERQDGFALVSVPADATSQDEDSRIGVAAAQALRTVRDGARTILVVEDDERFRSLVCQAVRSRGFDPIECADGEVALEILRRHVPGAILLDIKLPGMSGMMLLERVKGDIRLRHIPTHVISALEHQQNALRMGAIGYLGKPVTIEAVRSALARIEDVMERKLKRLLVVEDDERQRQSIIELVSGDDTEVLAVGTGQEAYDILTGQNIDCAIVDLGLSDTTGFEMLERLNERADLSLPPIVIYTGRDLSRDEEQRLRRFADSIIIKGAKSPERLLDEVSLFLHRMEGDLPPRKREMLVELRTREPAFYQRQVLVVDDDVRNIFALTSALEAKGFRVTPARNGVEAIEKLEGNDSIELILMDIMMPKMDGLEAMRRIRQMPRHRSTPIIALTAKTMRGDQEKCIEAGASDFLPKPVHLMSLFSALKVWLPQKEVLV